MEPILNPDGTWTVISVNGNVTRTNHFTADWVFTGAEVVTIDGNAVITENYNASEQMTSAKSVITEGGKVTTTQFDGNWNQLGSQVVDSNTPGTVTTMDYNASGAMTGAVSVITEGNTITTRTFDGNWKVVSETTTGGEPGTPPTATIGDVTILEGGEAVFTVTLSGPATGTVTVDYATAAGATGITPSNGTLTFAAGETTKPFTVQTTGNKLVDGSRTFDVNLSNATGGLTIADASATGTITDDDTPPVDLPTISIANAPNITEGADANFVITLSKASPTPITVKYVTVGAGSATEGEDFVAQEGTITIPANTTVYTLTVKTIDDQIVESRPETFSVSLSDATGATLAKDGAFVNIADNDTATTIPTVSVADATATAEGSNMIFTVSLSAPATGPVSVQYFGSISTLDYTSPAGTLNFAAGETTKTISVPIHPDTIVDPNETVTVTLINPVGVTLADATATGTITDGPPVSNLPTISINDITVDENGTAFFTVTLSKSWSETVEVRYATENGTALAGSDYVAKEGVIRFFPGQTTTSLAVQLQDDGNSEPVEALKMNLLSPVNGTIAKGTGTLTINDNDAGSPPPPAGNPFTAVATGQIRDDLFNGAGADSVDTLTSTLTTFQRQLEGLNEETRGALEYDLSSVTGTITSAVLRVPMEFVWDAPEQLRAYVYAGDKLVSVADWNAGTLAGTTNFTTNGVQNRKLVDITLDAATVQAAKAAGGTVGIVFRADGVEGTGATYEGGASFYRDGAVLFVDSQDTPPPPVPTVTISDATAVEGGQMTFTVTLSEPATGLVEVIYGTGTGPGVGTANAADFINASGSISFAAGETTKTVTVQTTQDTAVEPDETFVVRLQSPTGATLGTKSVGTGTITNDDSATPVTISISDATVGEGGVATLTITLSRAADGMVDVNYATSLVGGSAGESDFTQTGALVQFAVGETSKTITIQTTQDTIDEQNETFNVNLFNPRGAVLGTKTTGTVTITDNDDPAPIPTVTISDAQANEGGVITFTATLSAAPTGPVSVNYATNTTGGTASANDFTAANGTLTWAVGDPLTKTFTIQTTQDTTVEPNETFNVALSSPTGATLGAKASGVGTIVNDDQAPLPTLTVADVSAAEGDTMTFTVTLSAAASGPVTVGYNTSTGTAGAGDFTAGNGTLTFAAGETTKTVTINTTEDTAFEPDEVFNFNLTAPTGATIADGTAMGNITNDDAQPTLGVVITQTGGSTAVTEGGATDSFTIALSSAPTSNVTVTIAANADLTYSQRTFTFSPTNWATPRNVTVTATNDITVEGTETSNITFTTASTDARYNALAVTPVPVTVTDNDSAPARTLSVSDVTVTEGGAATVTVSLSGAASGPVTVNYATAPGTAVAADFTAATGSLTFAAGETTKTVAVTTINDTLVEQSEAFNFNISGATGATVGDSQGVITITDNDTAGTPTTINGTAVANTLNGTAANEIINGLGGNDTMNGGGGDDQLNGGAGADQMRGGTGNDTMTGGAGTDRFIFDTAPAANNVDMITDIDLATEALFLENAVFNVGRAAASLTNPLVLQAQFFRAGAAQEADDRILFDQATGTVSYDADGNGAGAAVAFAKVTVGTTLSAADFYVI